MDDDLSRIGISLPKHLLDRFDEILNYRGYSSRSEGIRDAERARYAPGETFDEFPGGEPLAIGHIPEGVQEGVRAPTKFVRIVQAVADQLKSGAFAW